MKNYYLKLSCLCMGGAVTSVLLQDMTKADWYTLAMILVSGISLILHLRGLNED